MAVNDNGGAQNPGGQQQQPQGQDGGQQQQQQGAGGQQQNPNAGGQRQQQQAGGQQQQQQQQQQPRRFEYTEDRSDWAPPHRLSELAQARRAAEQNLAKMQADLEAANKRIQALAGVSPQDPQEVEAEQLRGVIGKLFPKLALLDNLDEDALNEILEAAGVARQSSNAVWERHTHGVLQQVDTEAARVLGVPKLDEKTQKRIWRAFRDEGNQAEAVRQQQVQSGQRASMDTTPADNDFIARFERGDAELVKEFVKDYLDSFIEPVRRSVTASVTRFRPVPRGDRNRAPVVQGQQQQDLNTRDGFAKALLAARGQGGSNT